ncbi:hypothetical protein EUGRSUZ_G03329 [Eucalyptus grandis]|uniref:Uncharacterized protein n=2 Tax=Eucalyptus grandis TaxID=71139 RepID=A0ACC3K9F5_EUCGR|nr:hypothetical protein EUGRSUZ_G03329 [Eucalyptus grandis]
MNQIGDTSRVNVYDTTNWSHPISMYGSDVSEDYLEHLGNVLSTNGIAREEGLNSLSYEGKPHGTRWEPSTARTNSPFVLLVGTYDYN